MHRPRIHKISFLLTNFSSSLSWRWTRSTRRNLNSSYSTATVPQHVTCLLTLCVCPAPHHDLRWHLTGFRLFYLIFYCTTAFSNTSSPQQIILQPFSEPQRSHRLTSRIRNGGIWHIGILLLYPSSSILVLCFDNDPNLRIGRSQMPGLRIGIPISTSEETGGSIGIRVTVIQFACLRL